MFTVRVEGLEAAAGRVRDLPRQMRFASARALNDVAQQHVRPALQAEMDSSFDRPTPFIKNSIWVDRASPDSLVAKLYPRYLGGKSVNPANVLQAEVRGGGRRAKRAELAFQRVGILPPGWFMVPSNVLLADSNKTDGYGNVRGSFIVQLLAYFNAFGEQGYRANMTDKRRGALAKVKRSANGFIQVRGVQYFVSHGRGTRGANALEGRAGRQQHLPPGIWSRSGTHGVDVKPVFLFVRAPHYSVRYRMGDVVNNTVRRVLPRLLADSVKRALATAR